MKPSLPEIACHEDLAKLETAGIRTSEHALTSNKEKETIDNVFPINRIKLSTSAEVGIVEATSYIPNLKRDGEASVPSRWAYTRKV